MNGLAKFLRKFLSLVKEVLKALLLNIKRFLKWLFSKEGLTIALLAGILAHLTSAKIQDIVRRQRYLEMLQYEIRNQTIEAARALEDFNEDSQINGEYYLDYDAYLAGLESGYILTIDPEALAEISNFYKSAPEYNSILKELYSGIIKFHTQWEECIFKANPKAFLKDQSSCDKEKFAYEIAAKTYSKIAAETWLDISKSSQEIFIKFNPTGKRLGSPFLKFLMGDQAMEYLK